MGEEKGISLTETFDQQQIQIKGGGCDTLKEKENHHCTSLIMYLK